MKTFSQDRKLQLKGMKCVARLACENTSNIDLLRVLGTPERIVSALQF